MQVTYGIVKQGDVSVVLAVDWVMSCVRSCVCLVHWSSSMLRYAVTSYLFISCI